MSSIDKKFYVCTADNGYALWYVTIPKNKSNKCSYSSRNVYLNIDGTVSVFDKLTGRPISTLLPPKADANITKVYDDNDGLCFVVLKKENKERSILTYYTNNFSQRLL
jgi:hypothetical protein